MSQIQQIKRTIQSTTKTKKITRAMQLVSTSKLGKSQKIMQKSRPYAQKLTQVLGHLSSNMEIKKHPFLKKRKQIKHTSILLFTSDRGLCGSLNHTAIKKAEETIQEIEESGGSYELLIVGQKGIQYFEKEQNNITFKIANIPKTPTIEFIQSMIDKIADQYATKKTDHILIISNIFASTLEQKIQKTSLLPIQNIPVANQPYQWQYDYEPQKNTVLDYLLHRYIEYTVYQYLKENIACEHAARMMAMKNATDNATCIINNQQLAYNKARQATITTEIAEIISGAAALD